LPRDSNRSPENELLTGGFTDMQDKLISRRVTRFFAGLMIGIGLLCVAAIGLAAAGNASTDTTNPQPPRTTATVRGPLIVATPNNTAPRWVPPQRRTVLVPVESFGE
jgi:hypothetical protein